MDPFSLQVCEERHQVPLGEDAPPVSHRIGSIDISQMTWVGERWTIVRVIIPKAMKAS